MMENLKLRITAIMTKDFDFVYSDTLMLEVDKIFQSKNFHYLPVLSPEKRAIGIISKTDYYALLHHFTHKKLGEYERYNRIYLRSLRAEDIMTKNPVSIDANQTVEDAIDVFLKNKHRSVLINNDEGNCIGICTPFDIIKWVKMANSKLSKTA